MLTCEGCGCDDLDRDDVLGAFSRKVSAFRVIFFRRKRFFGGYADADRRSFRWYRRKFNAKPYFSSLPVSNYYFNYVLGNAYESLIGFAIFLQALRSPWRFYLSAHNFEINSKPTHARYQIDYYN